MSDARRRLSRRKAANEPNYNPPTMNQHQRKFLLEAIEKQYKAERSALNDRKPKEPSMNNYLIAAILDGSFKMKSSNLVRDAIVARTRTLGKSEALLTNSSQSWGRDDEDSGKVITLPANLLFELPNGYTMAFAQFEEDHDKWKNEVDALEASIQAMRIKVQIGSDKSLEALVEQADTLCSMSLTASNKLLLGGPK